MKRTGGDIIIGLGGSMMGVAIANNFSSSMPSLVIGAIAGFMLGFYATHKLSKRDLK